MEDFTLRRDLASRPFADGGTHVRLDIYPDGGLARLPLLGRPDAARAVALESRFAPVSSS